MTTDYVVFRKKIHLFIYMYRYIQILYNVPIYCKKYDKFKNNVIPFRLSELFSIYKLLLKTNKNIQNDWFGD